MGDLSQFAKQIKEDNARIEALAKKCEQLKAHISSVKSEPTEDSGHSFTEPQYQKIYKDLLQIKKVMEVERKDYKKVQKSNVTLSKENELLLQSIKTMKGSIEKTVAEIEEKTPNPHAETSPVGGKFVLPDLPWAKDALKPHISQETINFHYGKHHTGYVKKLNIALGKEDSKQYEGKTLEELIRTVPQGKMWNCAAQHWNHSFYWKSMSPDGGEEPKGSVKRKIDEDFGSFANFKAKFTATAAGHFGSGWAWLLLKDGKLVIEQTHNAGCPISTDLGKPILTCDVWEHAYYVDYKNDRGSYLKNWWNLVNWDFAYQNLGPVNDIKPNTKTSQDENKGSGPSPSTKDIFSLPNLPWEKNALEPNISENTINFHYGKHHTGYVKKLNIALSKDDAKEFQGLGLEELIKKVPKGKLWNCAAQHWNHSFYWKSMSPNGGKEPKGSIGTKINEDFGSFEKFKEAFTAAATGLFGSGWAWLLLKDGKLVIEQTRDAGCPISTDKGKPILTCDVWEHAYYVDQKNDRGAYVKNWWNLVNWDFANANLSTQEAPRKQVKQVVKKDAKKEGGKKKVGKKSKQNKKNNSKKGKKKVKKGKKAKK